MTTVTNGPGSRTVIRAEVRKSFAFGVWIKDHHGRPLDITDVGLHLVAKKVPFTTQDDTTNLIVNSVASLVSPTNGYAVFNFQASDLNHKPDEYPFAIVMIDEGYSTTLVKGTLLLEPNTEFYSVGEVYDPAPPVTTLQILLRGRNTIEVLTGPTLAPGTTSFTDGDKVKLDSIEEGAQRHIPADWNEENPADGGILNKPALGTAAFKDVEEIAVPPGGSPGEVLVKRSSSSYDVGWAQQSGGGGGGAGLDPTGVLAGRVPTANGADGWSWADPAAKVESVNGQIGVVVLNQDSVADTSTRVAMTPAERSKLSSLTVTTEWTDVLNKPAFGSASLLDATTVLLKGQINATTDFSGGTVPNARLPRVSAMPGFSSGTTPPVGGSDGDLYFQYT